LAGPVAASMAGLLVSGPVAADPCQTAAEAAASGLARMSPRHQELLTKREADPTPLPTDLETAEHWAFLLADDLEEAAHHVAWLGVVTRRLVFANRAHVVAVADALLKHDVLDATAFLAIVSPKKESTVFTKKRDPNQLPADNEDGVWRRGYYGQPVQLPAAMSLGHSHCVIAVADLDRIGYGVVRAGALRDDRSGVVAKDPHPANWRRPTQADHDAAAARVAETSKAGQLVKAQQAAKAADTAATAATAAARVAAAALADAKSSA
jgi:hypothetical protein